MEGGQLVEEKMSFQDIVNIIRKRLLLIIGLTIMTMSVATVLSFYILTPIYQAQTQILVNQKGNSGELYSWSQIETELQLMNTYNDIIKSPVILSKVIDKLTLATSPEQLTTQITLLSENNSKVFTVKVEDPNPEQAVLIANTIADVFKVEIPLLMNVDNINILSAAKLSERPNPVKPRKLINIAIGAAIGMMLGIVLALLLEKLDTTIKSEKDVEELLNMPIMGIVSSISLKKEKKFFSQAKKVRRNRNVWVEK